MIFIGSFELGTIQLCLIWMDYFKQGALQLFGGGVHFFVKKHKVEGGMKICYAIQ